MRGSDPETRRSRVRKEPLAEAKDSFAVFVEPLWGQTPLEKGTNGRLFPSMIVAISGDTVRIGIDAPRDLKILRSEIYEEIQRQNREAVKGEELGQSLQLLKEFRIDRGK